MSWSFTGTLYQNALVTEAGNSGQLDITTITKGKAVTERQVRGSGTAGAISRMRLTLTATGLTGSENLTVLYEQYAGGTKLETVHTFPQLTLSVVDGEIILPGDGNGVVLISTTGLVPAPMSDKFRVSWTTTDAPAGCAITLGAEIQGA